MHLISSLCAGIRGAENGTVGIFVRATNTRAVFYSDFAGTVHPRSGFDVTLDENGSAIIYVNEFVDVVVQDVDGTEVRNFVEAVASPNVEVISNSFTGRDLVSGASGTNKPTNLQTVLDLWITQNGAEDWQVLLPDGSKVTIQEAVAGVAGIFFNVKDPTYGAVGDGITDDTTPIQNALNAAAVNGGIVIFPRGTYRITAKITVAINVSLWGLGGECSVIGIDHATADAIEFGAGSSYGQQEIRLIGVKALQANTGKLISVTAAGARRIGLHGCVIGRPSGLHSGDPIVLAAGELEISDSVVLISTSGGINASTGGRLNMRQSLIALHATGAYNGALIHLASGTIVGCQIIGQAATSGTNQAIWVDGTSITPNVQVTGCSIQGNPAGVSVGFRYTNGNIAGACFIESGNALSGWDGNYSGVGIDTNNPQIQLVTRESNIFQVSSNAGAVDLQGDVYGSVVLTRTAAGGAQALSSNVGPPGAFLTVVVYNNSGGALSADISFSTGFYDPGGTGTPNLTKPANGNISVAYFRAEYAAGTGAWVRMSAYLTDI